MADLTTLAGIEAELADTADYDVALDVSKAKRRVAAFHSSPPRPCYNAGMSDERGRLTFTLQTVFTVVTALAVVMGGIAAFG